MLGLKSKMKNSNFKIDQKKIAKEIEESYLPISALIGDIPNSKQSGGGKYKVVHKIDDITLKQLGYKNINSNIIGKDTLISSKIVNKIAKDYSKQKMNNMSGGKFGFGNLFGNEVPAGGSELLFKSLMGSPIQNNYERALPYNNESIMPDGNYNQPDYSPSTFGGGSKRRLMKKQNNLI
tara:strand:+ start:782 stop:1318 length:537 start_codon:yes stop_codon:yes gene_type:complete